MSSWRYTGDRAGLTGLTSAELRDIATLWKRSGRELVVSFSGSSMLPTIAPGTELLLRCADDVKLGDVLVYVFLDQVAVHRLVAIGPAWLLTRGDALIVPDPPITDWNTLIGTILSIRAGETFIPVPPPPRSLARSLAVALVRLGGVFGVTGMRAALAVLRAASRVRRLPKRPW